MVVPLVTIIEAAAHRIKSRSGHERVLQQNELTTFGSARVKDILGSSGLTPDLRNGYELGLEVARLMLKSSPALKLAKVDPDQIL
jgi:hypothetical protein